MKIIKKVRKSFENVFLIGKYTFSHKISPLKLFLFRRKGFTFEDVFAYQLTRKNWQKYLNSKVEYKPIALNQNREISSNKLVFPYVMGKYAEVAFNVGVIYKGVFSNLECNKEDRGDFTTNLMAEKQLFCKPVDGRDGIGCHLFEVIENVIYDNNKAINEVEMAEVVRPLDNYIVQKTLKQSSFSSSLFPKTINTIRLITYQPKDSVRHAAVCAVQRVGTEGSFPVDNFNKGGLSFLIDIKNGSIGKGTYKIPREHWRNRIFYSEHPDTGFCIEGLDIPRWHEIVESVLDITLNFPYWRFIAWDILITDEGFLIVETNMKSDLKVFQVHEPHVDGQLGNCFRELELID